MDGSMKAKVEGHVACGARGPLNLKNIGFIAGDVAPSGARGTYVPQNDSSSVDVGEGISQKRGGFNMGSGPAKTGRL